MTHKGKGKNMLPIIVGGAVLSAIGYGVGKLIVDDEFRDNIREKIGNASVKAYDSIDKLEEKMGLHEYTFTEEEAKKTEEDIMRKAIVEQLGSDEEFETQKESL